MAAVNSTITPPKDGASGMQRLHLRRSPPHESVSLPQAKKQKCSHSPEDREIDVPGKGKVLVQETSLGSGSDQSASRWFDDVNKHVGQKKAAATYDDEPPFFMVNRKNYNPKTFEASETSLRRFGGVSHIDSENEDLRGVIDDLTVENKRLKQILRTHQSRRASPSADSQDKLFEVRMHGLPAEKRRELEFLLKNFATSVHASAPSISQATSNSAASPVSGAENKPKTDSGYVSNSNSVGNSLPKPLLSVPRVAKDKNIKSYLHDIPNTLLPRQSPLMMSERARMALVVRRLEQLFTGKSAAPGEHSQPIQQQEISQIAARFDATNNKTRNVEGTREARILPPDSKVNFDAIDTPAEKRSSATVKSSENTDLATESHYTLSRPESPDQRPTRPLDLDIHRAQVAAENMQYLQHLGLGFPLSEQKEEAAEHPWTYLNLLVNMAQLHTINVTPEFVRRSIKKMSTKLELGKDGHKVRWIGGVEGTVFSKEEEKALETVDNNRSDASPHDSTEDLGTSGSSKRSKTDSTSNAVVSNTTSEDKTSGQRTSSGSKQLVSTGATSNLQSSDNMTKGTQQTASAFDYKPIVYRGGRPELEDNYLQDSDSSHDSTSRDSSALVQALSKSNLNQQRSSDEGLITFYNNAFFCSDYSGDKMPRNMLHDRYAIRGEVIGLSGPEDPEENAVRYVDACYFTPQFGPKPFQQAKDEKQLSFNPQPILHSGEDVTQPMDLACSGIGGINADDNFAFDVKVSMSQEPSQRKAMHKVSFTGTEIAAVYTHRAISAHRLDLLPSFLPPANYIFFTSSSSSGNIGADFSDSDSDGTTSSANDEVEAPPAFLQRWSIDDPGDFMEEDDQDHDSSSMDMLAMARAADPERIAEQERQYMITQPGGRAVAGSLAATVGASRTTPSVSAAASDNETMASDMEMDEDDEQQTSA